MVLRRDEAAVAAWDLVLGSDTRSLTLHGRPMRVLTEDYRRLQAKLSRAMALGRLGRAEAGAVFREVFESHAGQLEGAFVARVFEEALRTLEVARAAYLAHLEAHGEDHNTWRRAAGTWISMRFSDEAIAAWNRVLALAPDAHAWFGKAEALAQQGQLDAAIAAYERSLELQPGIIAAEARLKVVRAQQQQQQAGKVRG
jgi:tetratricopeptide (TPR) repeat protein